MVIPVWLHSQAIIHTSNNVIMFIQMIKLNCYSDKSTTFYNTQAITDCKSSRLKCLCPALSFSPFLFPDSDHYVLGTSGKFLQSHSKCLSQWLSRVYFTRHLTTGHKGKNALWSVENCFFFTIKHQMPADAFYIVSKLSIPNTR